MRMHNSTKEVVKVIKGIMRNGILETEDIHNEVVKAGVKNRRGETYTLDAIRTIIGRHVRKTHAPDKRVISRKQAAHSLIFRDTEALAELVMESNMPTASKLKLLKALV